MQIRLKLLLKSIILMLASKDWENEHVARAGHSWFQKNE